MAVGLKNPTNRKTFLQDGLEKLISINFVKPEMFKVVPELHKYRADMLEEVFLQKSGSKAQVCEVYFAGEFLCDVTAKMRPDEALALIQFSLMNKVKYGKGGGK